MSASTHTSGPWTCETNGKEWWVQTPAPFRKGVAECIQSEADARLIAAAPDLLSELKRMANAYVSLMEAGRDRIIQWGGDCDPVDVMEAGSPCLRSAKEVIAKAEGQP